MFTTSKNTIQTYRQHFQTRLRRQRERQEAARLQALQAIHERIPDLLAVYPSVRRAYLFGSVIHPGTFHTSSDIDIAVEGMTVQEYFALWRALEQALPEWRIDLCDITAPSPFVACIHRTGVLLYERTDPSVTSRNTR